MKCDGDADVLPNIHSVLSRGMPSGTVPAVLVFVNLIVNRYYKHCSNLGLVEQLYLNCILLLHIFLVRQNLVK